MATLVVTLAFSSDDGWAEKFEGNASCVSDGAYSSGEGNPAGSAAFTCGASCTTYTLKRSDYTVTTTFEDFGVPAGQIITNVSAFGVDCKHEETGASNGNNWHELQIECNYIRSAYLYDNSASTGNVAWHSLPLQSSYTGQFPLLSSDQCAVIPGIDVDIGAGGTAAVYFDNITFTITYEAPPPVSRFYLPSSGTPPLPSLGIGTYWDRPTPDPQMARLPTFTTRQNTALTTSNSTWTTTSSTSWLWWQFQTEPLAAALSLVAGDTIKFVLSRCREASISGDTYLEGIVRSVSGDGSTVTNELIRWTALGTEFSTTAASRIATATLTGSFSIGIGERLIFEVGVYGQTPALTNIEMRIGDPNGTTEHSGTSTSTADYVPWIETSFECTFSSGIDVELDGSVTQTKQTSSGTLTFTDVDVRLLNRDYTQAKQTVSGTLTFPDVFLHEGATQTGQVASGTLTFPAVFLHEGVTQTGQTVSGTLTFVDVDVRLLQRTYIQGKQVVTGGLSLDDLMLLYGAATQRRHKADGGILIPLQDSTDTQENAPIQYQLLLDAVEYPLVQALITRHVEYEKAHATIPSALIPEVIAAAYTTLTINMIRLPIRHPRRRSRLRYTGGDVIQMFTGTIDYPATSRAHDFGRLFANGAASYTARVNRNLVGAPYYIRDSGPNSAVRGPMDAAMMPGDVIKYSNVRQLQITKVIFSIDRDYPFMEASNGW